MSEKVSTITLRLTAEEAEQLEALKSLTGKRSASEAIKYIVREYPRFCIHYKQEAKEHGELKRKYREQCGVFCRHSTGWRKRAGRKSRGKRLLAKYAPEDLGQ